LFVIEDVVLLTVVSEDVEQMALGPDKPIPYSRALAG
jgi:hypothetical protein